MVLVALSIAFALLPGTSIELLWCSQVIIFGYSGRPCAALVVRVVASGRAACCASLLV